MLAAVTRSTGWRPKTPHPSPIDFDMSAGCRRADRLNGGMLPKRCEAVKTALRLWYFGKGPYSRKPLPEILDTCVGHALDLFSGRPVPTWGPWVQAPSSVHVIGGSLAVHCVVEPDLDSSPARSAHAPCSTASPRARHSHTELTLCESEPCPL